MVSPWRNISPASPAHHALRVTHQVGLLPKQPMLLVRVLNSDEGYAGVPSSFSGHAAARPLFGDEKQPMSQLSGAVPSAAPSNSFDYSSNAGVPPSIPAYPTMQPNQPTAVQPTTRGEDMVYPGHFHDYTNQPQQPSPMNNHLMSPQSYGQAPLGMPGGPAFSSATYSQGDVTYQVGFAQAGDRVDSISQQRGLDIVLASQKPTQAKRGPFKSNNERQATAETRKIGSCIRCRMQRIRVSGSIAEFQRPEVLGGKMTENVGKLLT